MTDTYQLNRFINAQNKLYADVVSELSQGRKKTHWMWFIFPQIDGLAHSETAKKYAIKSVLEAQAYLSHPVLGKRLIECTRLVLELNDKTANEIFGTPDDLKFNSSMTLFNQVAKDNDLFKKVIDKYYNGHGCDFTEAIFFRH